MITLRYRIAKTDAGWCATRLFHDGRDWVVIHRTYFKCFKVAVAHARVRLRSYYSGQSWGAL